MAISLRSFLMVELVGAAVLALWAVAVFPRLGPRTLRSTLVALIGALVLLQVVPLGVPIGVRLPYGTYVVLFGWVLPSLLVVFLSLGWTLRLLAGKLGGGPGGGGHRVPA